MELLISTHKQRRLQSLKKKIGLMNIYGFNISFLFLFTVYLKDKNKKNHIQ